MYKKFSAKITQIFIKNDIIKLSDREVYEYGFELLISSAVSIFAILIISLITKSFFQSLLFVTGFVLTRSLCGGYHADTHISCFTVTMINYAVFLLVVKTLNQTYLPYYLLLITLLTFILIVLLSPMDHKNKPLTENEIKKHRKKSRIAASFYLLVANCLSFVSFLAEPVFSFMFGAFSVSISLIISKIQQKTRKEDNI